MKYLYEKIHKLDSDGLLRHSALVFILTNLGSACNFLFHFAMGRTLSLAEYGILITMLNLINIVIMPVMALQNTLAYFTSYLMNHNDSGHVRGVVMQWTKRLFYWSTPICIVMLLALSPLSHWLHMDDKRVLAVAVFTLYAALYVPVFTGTLQGLQSFFWMCFVANAWGVVRLVLGVVFVLWLLPSALYGMGAYGLGMTVSVLLGAVIVKKATQPSTVGRATIKTDRYLLGTAGVLLMYSTLMFADMVLIKHYFTSPDAYGSYARASTIARIMIFLAQPFAVALFPKVVSKGTWDRKHKIILLKSLAFAGGIIMGAALFSTLFPKVLLMILYKDMNPVPELLLMVRVVPWAMVPIGIIYILLNFELAQHRFTCGIPLALAAVVYVLGVHFFHQTLWQIIYILFTISWTTLLVILGSILIRKHVDSPDTGSVHEN